MNPNEQQVPSKDQDAQVDTLTTLDLEDVAGGAETD